MDTINIPTPAQGGLAFGGPNHDIIFITTGTSVLDINTASIGSFNRPGTTLLAVEDLFAFNGYPQTLDPYMILGA